MLLAWLLRGAGLVMLAMLFKHQFEVFGPFTTHWPVYPKNAVKLFYTTAYLGVDSTKHGLSAATGEMREGTFRNLTVLQFPLPSNRQGFPFSLIQDV